MNPSIVRLNIQDSATFGGRGAGYAGSYPRLITTLFFIGILILPGCNKYLDKEPDNRTVIKTPEQIAQLLTSAYPHANYILFCEAMSDNAEDKQGSGSSYSSLNKANQQSYKYEVVEIAPDEQDGPDNYWVYCYKAIAAANQALEMISASADQSKLSAHRGEALVARAYAHFMLVTLFAKAYDPATAVSDPGIPYVTEPEKEVFKQYDRKTVAYVYEMIEKDLLEGYPLIDDKIYNEAPKFHFNKKAAAAFAARFYLFKQDYGNTVTYASQALSAEPANDIRPWNTTLTNLPYNKLQTDYTKATTKGNLLLQEADSFWGDAYPSLRYGIGESIAVELLINTNVTGGRYAYDLYGASPRSYNIPKFYTHFVATSINASTGQPYNTIPLMTAEEALLNRSEAYIRLGNTNLAIKDMNAFASQNIDNYDAGNNNITAQKIVNYYGTSIVPGAINAVLDFKRAFFIHEGMRWFDILRLKIPVLHETLEGDQIYLAPDDKRRTLQLPVLTKQAGLAPNER